MPAQLGQPKTGQGGKGLLRIYLLCPDDLPRLRDRIEKNNSTIQLVVVYLCTKFKLSILNGYGDILGEIRVNRYKDDHIGQGQFVTVNHVLNMNFLSYIFVKIVLTNMYSGGKTDTNRKE